ncbi:cyclic nucleotide-binding domain-containing protein [Phormidium tenue FACHB-886]|nr:cyclic nucleotide-binding domain-containing protein [Phormidium tenue FACHB-886]
MPSSIDRLLFVRKVPIFQELRYDFLMRLASIMEELEFPAKHRIFSQGEVGRSLYILVLGSVRVHIGDRELAVLKTGACFGEMAIFDAEPRSASVTTLESCKCLMLKQQQLYEAIEETPDIAVNIIRLLSRRTRELNEKMNALQEERSQAEVLPPPPPLLRERR